MKKICTILFIALVLTLLSSCGLKKDYTYQVIETYRITTSSGKTSFLTIELPISYAYQTIGEIKLENIDRYSFKQKDGYQTLSVEIDGEGKEKKIIISYEVTLSQGINHWEGNLEDEYLLPTEYIDSDNQNIVKVAESLKVEGDQYKTAQNISKYVYKNIKFDKSTKINQDSLLASEVLEKKDGVCGDLANLMTALLRASGIPAKSINGLVLNNLKKSSDWGSPAGSHAWVEFYLDGKWYFADPSWGNSYFAKTDGYHLSYGTQPVNLNSQAYQDHLKSIENKGLNIIGAMTAPIKFVAWSEDDKATIIPKVEIVKQ